MHFMRKVERFLAAYDMPATKFGRLAVRDPRLLRDIRNGREPRPSMVKRIEAFMATYCDTHCALQLEKKP